MAEETNQDWIDRFVNAADRLTGKAAVAYDTYLDRSTNRDIAVIGAETRRAEAQAQSEITQTQYQMTLAELRARATAAMKTPETQSAGLIIVAIVAAFFFMRARK